MANVPPADYDNLHRFITHTAMCRSCTNRDGTTPGIRGCAAGHLLSVRASLVIRRMMRDGTITPTIPTAGA